MKLRPDIYLHNCDAVRITFSPWMAILRHESLYHSGVKSRNTPFPQIDRRFFAYSCPEIFGTIRNRTNKTIYSVASEIG